MMNTDTAGNAIYQFNQLLNGLSLTYNSSGAGTAPTSPASMGYGWSMAGLYSNVTSSFQPAGATIQLNQGDTFTRWLRVTVVPSYGVSVTYYSALDGNQKTRLNVDGSGNYVFTNPDQSNTTYNSSGAITKSVDRNGNTTTYSYDSSSRFNHNR